MQHDERWAAPPVVEPHVDLSHHSLGPSLRQALCTAVLCFGASEIASGTTDRAPEVHAPPAAPVIRPLDVEIVAEPLAVPGREREAALDARLERISRQCIEYFLEARTPTGLIYDRYPNSAGAVPEARHTGMASIAATGYGLSALPLAVEAGMISRQEGEHMALQTLEYAAAITPERYRGWMPHFIDTESGEGFAGSEISTIDTILFHAGAIVASEYFGGEVKSLHGEMFAKLDFEMMRTNDGAKPAKLSFSHGFHDREEGIEFLGSEWDSFSEGIILSLLALSDPRVPVESWEKGWDRTKRWEYAGMKSFEALPLFTYYYPLGYLDLRGKADSQGDNFWDAARKAVEMQQAWCKDHGYPESFYGVTACDGPSGYRAYHPGHTFGDKTVAPLAMIAAIPLDPEGGEKALLALERLNLLDGALGPVASFDAETGWTAPDTLGIDVGSTLLMVDLQRKGTVHSLFAKSEIVQRAMERAGFEDVH